VQCPACDHSNRDSARFCEACATPLAHTCASCGTELRPEARFCDACAHPVDAPAPVGRETPAAESPTDRAPADYTPKHLAEKILSSKHALEGERKQVTVLFADVKGSLDLASQVDPERWHAILDRFFSILADGVHRFEGTVNQYTGDGIMALFGAPIAHEDHAQRACYAALAMREELREYSNELRLAEGLDFAVRVGINSGEVVVGRIGDDLRMDYTAQGHTVGLAARMEAIAPANGIYLTQKTADLVSGYVSVGDLGTADVKGIAEPVHVYELEGMGDLQTRFDLSRARGLTRFVGRDADMHVLEQALEQAQAGNGQVVGVVAQAGTGKSRLCFEFTERCRGQGLSVLKGSGVAHGKNVPFLPILQIFRQYFGVSERDDDRGAREKIAGRLLLMGEEYREFLPLMFDFMGVPDREQPLPTMTPDARQRQLFSVLRRVVDSGEGSAVTVVEDLHWIDAGSEAWLEQMVEAVTGTRTLVVVNFRPEYHASWMQKSWYRQLPLLPLGPEAIRELLHDLLGADESVAELAESIHERSGGNPFFTEEIVQTLIESGALQGSRGSYRLLTPVERLEVPGTVQSVLAARIDRLPEREKQVLQAASVIGKEFAESILAPVTELDAEELGDALRVLKDGEFLFEQSIFPVTEYAFKHPLTQEVALGSQLAERRKKTHARVARATLDANREHLDEVAALLAHHHQEAGELLDAMRWHRRAASWLIQSDPSEAERHWQRVRALAAELPSSHEVAEHELWACDRLLSNGWRTSMSEEEQESLAARGRILADQLDDIESASAIEAGLCIARTLHGEPDRATEPGARAVEIAKGRRVAEAEATSLYLDAFWHGGQIRKALPLCERAIELAEGDHELGLERYGVPLANWALGRRGVLKQLLGEAAEGVETMERALAFARERDQREVAAWLLFYLGSFNETLTGNPASSLQRALQAMELAEQVGSPLTQVIAHINLGCAHLLAGNPRDAIDPLSTAQVRQDAFVGRTMLAISVGLLAEAHLAAGNVGYAREFAERCDGDFGSRAWANFAKLGRARVLRALDGVDAQKAIEATLDRADALIEDSGARAFEPLVLEERARLAALCGDEESSAAYLARAHAAFVGVGATGHAARLARELEGSTRQ
jgi:class 3 adenylate cyclase/tetratricopeptide (TPR) repeat protein